MELRGPPDARLEFAHENSAARSARQLLREMLAGEHGRIVDDVQLAASELVANVVRHTFDGGVVRAWRGLPPAPVRVEVEDRAPVFEWAPVDEGGPPKIGGRGLELVAALASSWGITPTQEGKVVWAEFPLHPKG